jgi:hypothetical protein
VVVPKGVGSSAPAPLPFASRPSYRRIMTEPITRTELYWRVDNWFHEAHPDVAAAVGDRPGPPALAGAVDRRAGPHAERGGQPATGPAIPKRRRNSTTPAPSGRSGGCRGRTSGTRSWTTPQPGEVQLQNAVSNDGTLDLSHIKASVREQLVDQQKGWLPAGRHVRGSSSPRRPVVRRGGARRWRRGRSTARGSRARTRCAAWVTRRSSSK